MPDVPYGLCHCGCGQKTKIAACTRRALGHVQGEPVRFLPGHNTPVPTSRRYIADEETDCWEWQLTKDRYGYGRMSGRKAHRVFYEEAKGPIAEGLVIDHLCGNPGCVNPDHLEAVPQYENMRRAGFTKLTPADAQAIRASSLAANELAQRYGVSASRVSEIRAGRAWPDKAEPESVSREARSPGTVERGNKK